MTAPALVIPWLFPPNWAGFVTPFFIVVKRADKRLIAHERCHVKQMWRGWLVGFAVLYLYYLWRVGYLNNPYEIEARIAENGNG